MVLNLLLGGFIEVVETQRVLFRVNFLEQPGFELHPFGLADLTFKDAFLDADAIVFTRPGHPAQATMAGFLDVETS